MRLVMGLLAGAGFLVWPDGFGRRCLEILPRMSSPPAPVVGSVLGRAWERARHWFSGRPVGAVTAQDLLGLLEAVAPALEAGMAPSAALRIAADACSSAGRPDPVTALARGMASAAADGGRLGPLWREAAGSAGSAELWLLAQAWSLTEDIGAPLAGAVRTTARMLEARIAHERRLAAAAAGAKATVNVLTALPIGGPLLALVLGIGPAELYGGSRLTLGSLALGLCLAGIGRWWARRMVRAVARGPVVA